MLYWKAKSAAIVNHLKKMSIRKIATVTMAALIGLLAPIATVADIYADDKAGSANTQTEQPAQPPSGQQNGQPPNGAPPAGDPPSGAPQGQPPSGSGSGADTQAYDYNGALSASKTADGKAVTIENETISSTEADKNVALAENGGTLTISGSTLNKSGNSQNADNTNFYGTNASVLAVGEKSQVYIDSSGITSTSEGSNGIFATDNASVFANNVAITTRDSNSARGLDATYGGTIIANNMTISTEGDHSATLATDRGGGNLSVANSTLSTKGSGSPLLYSTGNIQVDNVTGTASGSQIAGMEGKNRILISRSTLDSTNDNKSGSDPVKNGVILYQSTSGDADTSTDEAAFFQAVDSTLKTSITDGAMFYVTNTEANVVLSGTTLDFDSQKVNLISAVTNDNNWGQSGSNGGKLTFTGIGESLSGDVQVDKASSVSLYLLSGSTWDGSLAKGSTAENFTVNVDEDSTWTLTEDTTVGTLNAAKGAKVVDQEGKTVSIVQDGKTVVEGDSDVTLTVSKYTTKVKTSDSNKVSTDTIDRTDFDQYYKTTTAYGNNSGSSGADLGSTSDGESILDRISNWLKGVFA